MNGNGDGAPHLSVVICTRDREQFIAAAVESVLACDYPSFDVTVIDQSTTDGTEAALSPLRGDERLRYVHRDEAGLSRARNTGITSTTGSVIVFTDDDCVAHPDWLASIVRALDIEPDGDLLYGTVLPVSVGTPSLEIERPGRISKRDGYRVYGMGANFAARRELFAHSGLFDVVLGAGGPLKAAEDFDLAYRAYLADRVILLRPDVYLRHDGFRALDEWPGLIRNYGAGNAAFYLKHVRCRDPFMLWLTVRHVVDTLARWAVRGLLRRPGPQGDYLRGFFAGARASLRFRVDRATRLYVEP